MPTLPQKTALRSASSAVIESHFRRLDRYFRHSRWLSNSNRYRDKCIDRLRIDQPSNVQPDALIQYIAASALPHTLDGWGFLGRALNAQLRGDFVSCRHLAYYAELRAAMALLSSQGIGIFDKHHYVVNAAGSITLVPRNRRNSFDGTHILAWKALDHWSGLKRSSDLLSEIITPGGLPITDWQSGIFSQASFRVVGSTWLKCWGLDIERCADDQKLRNQSSYRPSRLIRRAHLLTDERASFVTEFWRLCEPSGSELFQRLDRHLLRMWLRKQYSAIKGKNANSANADFVKEMSNLVDRANPQGLTKTLWVEFLCDTVKHGDSSVISKVKCGAEIDASSPHLGMLARALMLLRLATGASRRLLINSGVDKTRLHFWWHNLGAELALWDEGGEPGDPQSLWLDIELAINEIEQWIATGDKRKMNSFRVSESPAIVVIDELERVGLWGIGL